VFLGVFLTGFFLLPFTADLLELYIFLFLRAFKFCTFASANPYLNFIKAKMTKEKNGYSLWLIHSMFTQSSFDVGDLAYVVNQWINENRNDLYKASIVKVGLRNESDYLGTCWLEIK
jgi:hypothetical protein